MKDDKASYAVAALKASKAFNNPAELCRFAAACNQKNHISNPLDNKESEVDFENVTKSLVDINRLAILLIIPYCSHWVIEEVHSGGIGCV
jgi:hypothetical protein